MTKRMLPIGILASGRGSNVQAIVDGIETGQVDAEVKVVLSDRQDAQALERAREAGIPSWHVNPREFSSRDAHDAAMADRLRDAGVELVVLAGYMRLITRSLLDAFPNRIINIHPSLLPAFPGLHAQRQAVEYGVKVAGCTVHFVTEGVDTGPIISQASVPVHDDDSEFSLSERLLAEEHRLLPRAVQLFAEDRISVSGRRVIIAPATGVR